MGWFTQDNNESAAVRVREGFDRDTGQPITEFIVADKAAREHQHLGINEQGETVFHNAPKAD